MGKTLVLFQDYFWQGVTRVRISQRLSIVTLTLFCCGPVWAQEGKRSPSFHDPFTNVVFPQVVVGNVLGFSFDVESRISNTTDEVVNLFVSVVGSDLSFPAGLLVNTQPYPPGGFPLTLGPKESNSLSFTAAAGGQPSSTGGLLPCNPLNPLGGICAIEIEKLGMPEGSPNGPAGGGATIDDLVFSFFYNLRDAQGNLLDKINIPPSVPARGISFVLSRGQGFDTGVALLVSPPQMVNVKVYLPAEASPLGIPGLNMLESNFMMENFRDDFFVAEVVPELPLDIPAALVEMTVADGQVFGTALGVQSEGSTVQIAGQNVSPIGPIRD